MRWRIKESEKLVVCVPACVWGWRRREGNTHRVSQACPEHEPSTSTTFKCTHEHTCTPAVSLPHLGHQCTQRHMHSNVHAPIHCTETQSNFYSAIIKFMQSSTGHFSPVVPVVLIISLDMVFLYISSSLFKMSYFLELSKNRVLKPSYTYVNITILAFREDPPLRHWAQFVMLTIFTVALELRDGM